MAWNHEDFATAGGHLTKKTKKPKKKKKKKKKRPNTKPTL